MVIAVMHCSRGPGLSWLTDDGNHLPDLPILMKKTPKMMKCNECIIKVCS